MVSLNAGAAAATAVSATTAASPLLPIARSSSRPAALLASENDGFLVAAERLTVDVCDLSQGRVGLDRVNQDGHEILSASTGVGHAPQLVGDLGLVPPGFDRAHPLRLFPLESLVEPKVWNRRLFRLDIAVHAD